MAGACTDRLVIYHFSYSWMKFRIVLLFAHSCAKSLFLIVKLSLLSNLNKISSDKSPRYLAVFVFYLKCPRDKLSFPTQLAQSTLQEKNHQGSLSLLLQCQLSQELSNIYTLSMIFSSFILHILLWPFKSKKNMKLDVYLRLVCTQILVFAFCQGSHCSYVNMENKTHLYCQWREIKMLIEKNRGNIRTT